MLNTMMDSILNGSFKASALGFVISCMAYFTGACSKAPEEAPTATPVIEVSETTGEEQLDIKDVLKSETTGEETKEADSESKTEEVAEEKTEK